MLTNMDGLEWHRSKWNWLEKAWLYLNEKFAVRFSNHLIADHPQIRRYYLDNGVPSEKIAVIPYCSSPVTNANFKVLDQYNLVQGQYAILIARPEPENSILEIVKAFSFRKRGCKLVILGCYDPQANPYHQKVLSAASDEVVFLGAIFDTERIQALRYYARLYVHGHTVGGTNPSLVEALAAGMPVLAHFNRFNYWVAGPDAQYFYDCEHMCSILDNVLDNPTMLKKMRQASMIRFQAVFANDNDLKAHEKLFLNYIDQPENIVEPEIVSAHDLS